MNLSELFSTYEEWHYFIVGISLGVLFLLLFLFLIGVIVLA